MRHMSTNVKKCLQGKNTSLAQVPRLLLTRAKSGNLILI